jgi:hypothetical protein
MDARRPLTRPTLLILCLMVATLQIALTWRVAAYLPPEPETAIGQALRPLLQDGDLVVVRSRLPARDRLFDTTNNFHDPRVFYAARARGWVVPYDSTASVLEMRAAEGARYYVETGKQPDDPEIKAWLAASAGLLVERPEGRIYALRGRRAPL